MMQRLVFATMMAGLMLMGLMLMGLTLTWPAAAQARGPVCREASVVDEMTREVRAANYYADVDPRLVTEQPTLDPRVVRCQVCVALAPYDTLRYGDRPVARCLPHDFDVRILPGGFVVQDLR